jgi:hypothetical protein
MWEVLVTLAAGVVGYFARAAVEFMRARRAHSRARVARLKELAALLHESLDAFQSQLSMARRLMAMLAQNHPNEMPDERLGYNQTFARLYPFFSDAERDLFFVIRGLTRDAIRRVNDRTSAWLRENDDVLRLEEPLVGPELAVQLRVLRQHLSEWHALFLATRNDEKRSLVFLADEFQTGTGFPTGIERLVDGAVERARTRRFSRRWAAASFR